MTSIPLSLPPTLRKHLRALSRTLTDVDLAEATAVVDRLVADSGDELHGLVRLGAVATETQTAVLTLGPDGKGAQAVVKVAQSPAAAARMRREADILRKLAADPKLAALRPLLPAVLAEGSSAGWTYVVQQALPGVPGDSLFRKARRTDILGAAAEIAGLLHRQTSTMTAIGPAETDRWIWRPAETTSHALSDRMPQATGRLNAVAGAAEASLLGCTLEVGWIHGDFWLGNVIFSHDGALVTGVVDWEQAQEGHLPLVDLLHLILYARRLSERRELGDVICNALQREDWSETERRLLARGSAEPAGHVVRAAIVICWLTHAAANFQQTSAYANNSRWLKRNVLRVLQAAES
jgi:aminoglycoside phosphotransferase (APT) family kinase protein